MPKLVLNYDDLLKLAQNEEVPTKQWAQIMHETRHSRSFFNERHGSFQWTRFGVEIGVKAAVSVVLGVGLFFTGPAAMLFGASSTLALSSLVYSLIRLPQLEVTYSENTEAPMENFNKNPWEVYRKEWCLEAQNHGFSAKQTALHTNLIRVGLVLVSGFALFTAIASGMAVPLAISCVLFAGALFYRQIDNPAPYFEKDELPALTMG